MSAEPVASLTAALAIEIIERHAAPQAEDIFQLMDAPADRALLAIHLTEAADILARDTQGAVIENAQQEAALVALQGRAYKVEKAMEDLRKRRLAPLQAEVKAINDLLGTTSNPGGFVFGALLARMGKGGDADRRQAAWRAAERARIAREQEAAERRLIDAARAADDAALAAHNAVGYAAQQEAQLRASVAAVAVMQAELEAPRQQVRGVKTEDGKKTFREEWTFEVVDPAQVPRQFLVVNDSLIRSAVKAGNRQIPGVHIYQVEVSRRGV